MDAFVYLCIYLNYFLKYGRLYKIDKNLKKCICG